MAAHGFAGNDPQLSLASSTFEIAIPALSCAARRWAISNAISLGHKASTAIWLGA